MILVTDERRREQLPYDGPARRFTDALDAHETASDALRQMAQANAVEALEGFIVGTVLTIALIACLLFEGPTWG